MNKQSVEMTIAANNSAQQLADTTLDQTSTSLDSVRGKIDYSATLVKVSKKLLAKYIIIHKCTCLFMVWIHLTMCLISMAATYNSSEVTSETVLCRYIFYASHYFYGYIHVVIMMLYLFLIASFKVKNFNFLTNNDWLTLFFLFLVIYVVVLKALSDLNCSFWGITFGQILLQGVQFAAEGVLLKMFYTWLHSKTQRLKLALEDNIDMEKTEQYTKL